MILSNKATLYSDKEKTEAIAPNTSTEAVWDAEGNRLDNVLSDMVTALSNQTKDLFKYSDEEVSVTTVANGSVRVSMTNDTPSGYAGFFATLRTGSTVGLRNNAFLVPTAMVNFNSVQIFSTSAETGTVTIRKWYIKTSAISAV